MLSAQQIIDRLGPKPRAEGGYFRETYRSTLDLLSNSLPTHHGGDRSISTCIYYLLTLGATAGLPGSVLVASALHVQSLIA